MYRILLLTTALLALAPVPEATAQTGKAEGEIRRIDRDGGKLTLRHGPVSGALEMPGMSMVFQVKDPALLDRFRPGDQVNATILKEGGVYYLLDAEKRN